MNDGRKRTTTLAAILFTFGTLGLHTAAPASAEPKVDDVKKQVHRLYNQAEKASERFNEAKIQLQSSKLRLKALDSDLERQQQVVDTMRGQVAALVVDQYQGQSLSTASQVLFAQSPKAFLDNLNAVTSYNAQRGEVIKEYRVQLQRLQLRKDAADQQVVALSSTRAVLRSQKQVIDRKAAAAKAELSKLEEKQRLAMLAGINPADYKDLSYTGRAGMAVKYALAQVGDRYVWGATGPSAYDCSGLTMMAWSQAGIGLPHSSRAQMGSGRRISEADLQPGDLVFYYSPVHHVGMYIGNGLIVNAENPSVGVRVTGLHSMPYSGAVRPG